MTPIPALALLLAAVLAAPTLAAPDADGYEWAVITHPGNRDTTPEETPFRPEVPIGGVDYVFRMATTEVTVGQWFEFVQAYAPFYPLNGGIAVPAFTGQSINYSFAGLWIYGGVSHQRPADMSWEYAARYCNWLHNGKVNEAWAFETGAYDTSTFTFNDDGTPNHQFERSPGARYWIPSLDEWTKAAHYDPNRYGPGQAGYWLYPNGSQERPIGDLLPKEGGGRNAGGSDVWPIDVASFPHVKSPFGLLDASGGMSEWLEERAADWGGTPEVMLHGGSPYIEISNTEPENSDRIDYFFGFTVNSTISWSGFRLAGILPCEADLAAPHGVLDRADLNAYLGLYQFAHPSADLAEPQGLLNFFDLAAYLNAFHAGCP